MGGIDLSVGSCALDDCVCVIIHQSQWAMEPAAVSNTALSSSFLIVQISLGRSRKIGASCLLPCDSLAVSKSINYSLLTLAMACDTSQIPELPESMRPGPNDEPEIVQKRRYLPPRPDEHFYAAMRRACVQMGLLDKDRR